MILSWSVKEKVQWPFNLVRKIWQRFFFSKEEPLDDEDDMVLLGLSASIRAVGGGKHLRAICSLGDLI